MTQLTNPTNEQELRAKIDTALSPIEELLFPTGYEEAEYGDPTEAMDNSMALGSALEKLEALIQAHTNTEIAKALIKELENVDKLTRPTLPNSGSVEMNVRAWCMDRIAILTKLKERDDE